MTSSSASRPLIDEALVLAPLSGEPRTGRWLRYEPVYDEIRQAREQENPYLSRGIWKRDLKRAEWNRVEYLSYKCLTQDSKDLQIMAWLVEAWTVLDGMMGFIRGMKLFTHMTKTFWEDGFPYPDEHESRQSLFEWMDKAFAERMYFFAISMPKDEYQELPWVLAEWRQAQRIGQIVKRTPDPKKELERAQAAGEPVLSDFEATILHTPPDFFDQALVYLEEARTQVKELETFLDEQMGDHTPSFSFFKEVFSDFERIWRRAHVTIQPKSESVTLSPEPFALPDTPSRKTIDSPPEIKNRDQAYTTIQEIADLLKMLEPQSLTPYILNRIAKWKDKSLPEILQSLTQHPSESALLLQLLVREETEEKPPVAP